MRKNAIKYSIYGLTILASLWAAIGFADSILTLVFFLLPAAVFVVLLIIDLIKWINNLDHAYSIDLGVKATPKKPLPVKVKGIPHGMAFNDYLVSLNKTNEIDE
jgi:hypothetical protein